MSTPQLGLETEIHTSSVWRSRNYLILLVTGGLMTVGGNVYALTLPLILYNVSHSSVVMTAMRAIEFLPNLLLAMLIGVWVDRLNKKRLILAVIALQSLLLFGLYFWHFRHPDVIWSYYLAGFILMTCNYAYQNTRISMTKHVLPQHLLTAANASYSSVITFIGICGPAISGLLLMLSDLHTGLLITALCFLGGWVLSMALRSEGQAGAMVRRSFWAEFQEGWSALRDNRALWQITMLVIFLNATMGMVDAIVVYYAKAHLHLANMALGVTLAVEGIGAFAGSRLVHPLTKRLGIGRTLGMTIGLVGVGMCSLVLAQNALLLAVGLCCVGLFASILDICIWTFRQESTPPHLIGRVTGITGSIFKVGMVWTIFGSGWLASWFGSRAVFVVAGVSELLVFLIYQRLSLKNLRQSQA